MSKTVKTVTKTVSLPAGVRARNPWRRITVDGEACVELDLPGGESTLVAECDYWAYRLWSYRWSAVRGSTGRTSYAVCHQHGEGKTKTLRLHRLLLGLGDGDRRQVDHVGGGDPARYMTAGLDNRRKMLREASQSQNQANSVVRDDSRTGFRGTHPYDAVPGLYRAEVCFAGKRRSIGYDPDPAVLAWARDLVALAVHGKEFCALNSIPLDRLPTPAQRAWWLALLRRKFPGLILTDPHPEVPESSPPWCPPPAKGRKHEFGGRSLTLAEWSKETRLDHQVIKGRLKLGWDLGRALTEPLEQARAYTHAGKTMTLREWGSELGLPLDVLKQRVNRRRWEIARALETPLALNKSRSQGRGSTGVPGRGPKEETR